jgi:ABC-type glycerol-3-phosphate transport system substrate-binding protein
MFVHSISAVGERTEKGQFLPLDDYLANWEDKDDVSQALFDLGEYQGHYYGVPWRTGSSPLAYRKDFVREAGLDAENPVTTYDELAEWAVKLTKKEGGITSRSGYMIPIDAHEGPINMALQLGDDKIMNSTDPSFNTPEFLKAVQYHTDLFQKGVSVEVTVATWKKQAPYLQGNVAVSYLMSMQALNIKNENPELKENTGFLLMKEERYGVHSGAQFYHINPNSKNADNCWETIKYFMTPEESWTRYEESGVTPIRLSQTDRFIAANPWVGEAVLIGMNNGWGAPKVEWSHLYLVEYIHKRVVSQSYYGKKTPEQAIETAWKEMQEEIEMMKKK